MRINNQTMRGFSLVELMVAMAIGLIILAAVSMVLVNSKKNYTTQDSLARLQENARFAIQFLTRDIRMTRYYGCTDTSDTVTSTVSGALGNGGFLDALVPIQGSDNKGNWFPGGTATPPGNMKTNTDAITLRYLSPIDAVDIDEPYMQNTQDNLHTSMLGLNVGDIVMVTDCSTASMFQITGPGSAGSPINGFIEHGVGGTLVPGNTTANLGKIYEKGARVSKFYYARYFIGRNAKNEPALYRDSSIEGAAQELVEGIEDLQIFYGVDAQPTEGDGMPEIYKTAAGMTATDWTKLVSVRIAILARTLANVDANNESGKQFGTDIDTKRYDMDGDGTAETTPEDVGRYQRRVFRTTIALRNYP